MVFSKLASVLLLTTAPLALYPSNLENGQFDKKAPSKTNFPSCSGILTEEQSLKSVNKLHILYLLQLGEYDKSIALYKEYQETLGRHDFEILQQIALLILEQGMRSHDMEIQLTSIFGCKIAGITAALDVLETAIKSLHPQTQLAAIQLIGSNQDDRSEELLTKAMSSDFFSTRMEAAYHLSLRKSRTSVGQIESLMYKVPPFLRYFFPQFFALIGTNDAIAILRSLMDDSYHATRIEAILNAARFGRDDLLPLIRNRATHLHVAEQEACAAALGLLKDSKSLNLLQKLSQSPSENIKLSALHALYLLGNERAQQEISLLAKQKNLFAIALLGDIPGSEETLASLQNDSDTQVRFNAMFSLLNRRDARCITPLKEFLPRDSRDFGYQPQFSVGNSLMCWKVIPSALQHQKDSETDLLTLTLHVKEALLKECLELPPANFIDIAYFLFERKQSDLIPLLNSLLANLATPEAIHLLQAKAQTAGAPLVRMYCHLGLHQIKPDIEQEAALRHWITLKKQTEMIRFRPILPWQSRTIQDVHVNDMTPEENSRLLIECYRALALKHDNKGIDILLDGLQTGQAKNRPVLAGLLIQAIQ